MESIFFWLGYWTERQIADREGQRDRQAGRM
jgi:hypothetical protein